MTQIKILGCGYANPSKHVSNHDLSKIIDTTDEWIFQRTGISSRYISEEENTSELAHQAALKAIKEANIEKESIEAIIVATMTPDDITPSTACLVQQKLGLNDKQIFAFDLNSACCGFLYAFQVATDLLQRYKTILIIGSETMSKVLNWQDRSTCVLFGDGAGAMIIAQGNYSVHHYANAIGDNEGTLRIPGLSLIKNLKNEKPTSSYLSMNGNEVFRFAIKVIQESIEYVLKEANMSLEDIDCIIPHQANYRIIAHVAKKMNVDIDKFYLNMHEYGNTSSASIPIAYAKAIEEGRINKNHTVLFVGFGSGLSYGATIVKGE